MDYRELRCGKLWQDSEQPMPLLSWRGCATLRLLSSGQDRQRFVAVRATPADEPQENCNSDSQGKSESNEIPQRGKSQNKNQGAARREKQANKSTAEGKLVHRNARMTFFGHGVPLLALIILPLVA